MSKLLAEVPSELQEIIEIRELCKTEEMELVNVSMAVNQLFEEQFVMTSSEQGILRREKVLGIQADVITESLEFRKRRLINRYSTKPPLTLRFLQQRLDYLVGEGQAVVSIDSDNFILYVNVAIENAAIFKEVENTIHVTKPANMVYQQQTALKNEIDLVEHISMQTLERNTMLSTTWQLGITPFATAGEVVVLK